MQRLLVGTYPVGEEGSGEGIWRVDLDTDGALHDARLLTEVTSPSFLAFGPDRGTLLAVTETEQGRLTEFELAGGELRFVRSLPTDGAHPCHVAVGPRHAWVANYGSGTAVAFDLVDGRLDGTATSLAHEGSGPVVDRQGGPHAHFCLPTPWGGYLWLIDLGTDRIRRLRADGAAVVDEGVAVTFPPGTGPRHGVLHASGTAFVVGELDGRVHVVRTDPTTGTGEVVRSLAACATPPTELGSYPSHVALSADGTRLYVAVRGPDVLSTFAVDADGSGLVHLADSPIGGVWPRHFAVLGDPAGDLVVVANQNSSGIAVLRMDPTTGTGTVVSTVDLPAPACILPM